MAQMSAGQFAEAFKSFHELALANGNLRAKCNDASQFQMDRVAESQKLNTETASTVWLALILGSLCAIAGAIFGGVLLTRSIATPLGVVVVHLGQIAEGDLSKDATAEFQVRGDEIGDVARAKQTMIVALRKMVKEIASGIQVLASSSTELMTTSSELTSGSRQASDKAHSVSAAAEEMSSNITSVAAGMEETTTNLAHVASATEEMTSTIGEIAQKGAPNYR